jgi:hypothetical protein
MSETSWPLVKNKKSRTALQAGPAPHHAAALLLSAVIARLRSGLP